MDQWKTLSSIFSRHHTLITITIIGYLLLAVWMPLTPNLARPLGLRDFTPSLLAGFIYVLFFSTLYGVYWQLYRLVRRGRWQPTFLTLTLFTTLSTLPLLFTYPFNANDLFRYAIRGRITAVYEGNPFTQPPAAFPQDPFLQLAGEWVTATTPYGPIWELTAAALSALTRTQPILTLFLLKALSLTIHLLIGWLIWRLLAASPTQQRNRTVLWLFNPALLLIFVADGHNDSLMLFWLILGWAIMRRDVRQGILSGRLILGFLVMVLSPLTKAVGVFVLPFFFLHILRKLGTVQKRILFTAYTGLGSLILAFLSFFPFGSPLELAQRLVNEAGSGASFSIGSLYLLYLRDYLEQPITSSIMGTIASLSLFFLALTALILCGYSWFRGRSPLRASADIFFAYILQALNFRLWYTSWSFPFLLLDYDTQKWGLGDVYRIHIGLWFLFLSQLSPFIYAHLWVYLLNQNYLLTHLIGVPFTLLLPFLIARFTAHRAQTI